MFQWLRTHRYHAASTGGNSAASHAIGETGTHSITRDGDYRHVRRLTAFDTGFIALCAAMNVTMGALATMFKLPLYLDSIGTVLIASLFGWWYGVLVGITGLVVLSLTTMPTGIAYIGTAVTIAVVTSLLARAGFLRTTWMTVIGGILIGVSSAFASVPVTTMFGGFSLAGSDAITAVFKTAGFPLWQSVLFGSLVTDIIDKLLTAIICLCLFRSLPRRILDRFPRVPTAP